jgi:hypothetical protein
VASGCLTPAALNADTSVDIDRKSDTQPMVNNGLVESAVPRLRLVLLRVEMVIVRCCEQNSEKFLKIVLVGEIYENELRWRRQVSSLDNSFFFDPRSDIISSPIS